MRRLTADELRRRTLQRQFPSIDSTRPDAVLELFNRLGPIQSQVPRAPFLTAASRLPGVSYETINGLFEEHRLLKTSNLRGTVHTSTRDQFGWLDAVARRSRAAQLRNYLKLDRLDPEDVVTEVEAYTDAEWRTRADIVAHLREWLVERESPTSAGAVRDALPESLLWGHSGLLRRPRDHRWEKRTDIYHRRARSVLPEIQTYEFSTALTELVRIHLGSYGPATREDLSFFFGTTLRAVDTAVRDLGDDVVQLEGPEEKQYLDVADAPTDGLEDPGLRLLPEYDGLFVGYAGTNRTRFLTAQQLPSVWAKVNGLFSPIVLHGGQIVATWKTLAVGKRTAIEVRMLDPHTPPPEHQFADAVAATEEVLALRISDLRVLAAR
jgi:DNA glycosylase AlkZ-like